MKAAEEEWLQEETADSVDDGEPLDLKAVEEVMSERYDWRKVARRRKATEELQAGSDAELRRPRAPKRYRPTAVAVAPGQPFFQEIESYRKHFEPLLLQEQQEEESVLEERKQWPIEKLKEEGYCLTDLYAFWLDATQFGRPVAEFSLGPGVSLGWHRFEKGTQVHLSYNDESNGKHVLIGSVVSKTNTQIRVAFEDRPMFDASYVPFRESERYNGREKPVAEGWTWRLDLGSSDIAYQRMRAAIDCLHFDPKSHESAANSAPNRQLIMQGTRLRDVLLHSFQPDTQSPSTSIPSQSSPPVSRSHQGAFSQNQMIQSWAKRYRSKDPIVIPGDPELNLNISQIRAIAMMLGERLSLVQGPPGTGKTKTIIEAVRLLKMHWEVPHPLLVCTYTNVAVDHLVEGLSLVGLNPLRVGFAGKVKPSLAPYTLDAQIEVHPLKKDIDFLNGQIANLVKSLKSAKTRLDKGESISIEGREKLIEKTSRWENDVRIKRGRVYAKQREMLHDIVSKADVLCTTCITSACAALQVTDFPVVFLDEASMSTEPASLIPIMKGSQHVTLIGDHKQLPPIIKSEEARIGGLNISLFERLTREGHVPTIMLDLQYRMHPALSQFPSSEFYNLALQDGTLDSSTSLLPPNSLHLRADPVSGKKPSVVFLDHGGKEEKKDRSRINWNEASIVVGVVEDLLLNNPTLKGEEIGIISPYIAQISLLTRLLRTDPSYQQHFNEILGRHRSPETSFIEIKTVDGFEGREKDIIIFSTVRSNEYGHIGFLADRRRMNVGLTRAKRGLFLVGNMRTLRVGKVGWLGEEGVLRVDGAKGSIKGGDGKNSEREIDAKVWGRYIEYLQRKELVLQMSGTGLRVPVIGKKALAAAS